MYEARKGRMYPSDSCFFAKAGKSVSAGRREKAVDAALCFGRCIARVFEDNLRRCDPEDDDDIDKQLRREIQAVKNGQNLVM